MPHSFEKVFFQLSSIIFNRPQYLFSDMKISLLRKYISSIWRTCFDSKLKPIEVSKMFKEPLERIIFDKLREDGIEAFNTKLIPGEPMFNFLSPSDKQEQDFEIKQGDKDSIIVMIHWIGAFINTCYYP